MYVYHYIHMYIEIKICKKRLGKHGILRYTNNPHVGMMLYENTAGGEFIWCIIAYTDYTMALERSEPGESNFLRGKLW